MNNDNNEKTKKMEFSDLTASEKTMLRDNRKLRQSQKVAEFFSMHILNVAKAYGIWLTENKGSIRCSSYSTFTNEFNYSEKDWNLPDFVYTCESESVYQAVYDIFKSSICHADKIGQNWLEINGNDWYDETYEPWYDGTYDPTKESPVKNLKK